MYFLQTEAAFDSAHFLKDYHGKCRNIHGHRWRVIISIAAEDLSTEPQTYGMLVDFSELKSFLKCEADRLDHCFIIEKDSLRAATMSALLEEGFRIVELPFRPTAENLARYFYYLAKKRGFPVYETKVYETPNNCASYRQADGGIG